MKKLLLMMMLIILSKSDIGQSYFIVSNVATGIWNSYTSQFDYGEWHTANMIITIKNKIVSISNNTYVLNDKMLNEDNYTHKQLAWNAIDEKHKNCMLKIYWKKVNGLLSNHFQLCVIYADDHACAYSASAD